MRFSRISLVLALAATLLPVGPAASARVKTCDGVAATIVGTARADHLVGTDGPDVIVGLGGDDHIDGLGGDDLICGNGGADVINGRAGADRIYGGAGRDLIRGGSGADRMYGGSGSDTVLGSGGNDTARGNDGADTLFGGAGDDRLFGGAGADWCRTGELARSCQTGSPSSAHAAIPGKLRVDATFENLGVLWWIDGDIDNDAALYVEFRESGSAMWRPGAPFMRAYPSIIVNGSPLGLNSLGASAMFLEPGTTYTIRATLTDPDGGADVKTVTYRTREMPTANPQGTLRHVVPGNGGGSGTVGDPYQGLQAAADAAVPGDIFSVGAGVYAPFELTTSGVSGSPIVFRGPDSGTARVDGGGTDRGVVTLGQFDQILRHVIIEGLIIEDGAWGVDAQNTRNIVIQDNLIRDVDFGVYNRRGNGWERNQTVCDNVIEGRVAWPGQGIPGERGIDLRGYGNVVCHNEVHNFGDCVSVQPATGPSFGNDIYGNDVYLCVDDGIEVDYNQANVRVYRNRVTNARMGVSVQPMRGGPGYILRNEFFNLESKPIKMHNDTSGFFIVHNTGVKLGDGYNDSAMWRNAVLRNNVFLGTRYAFEFTTIADEGFRDLDFNGWGTSRAIDPGGPWFKWDNVRYDHIADLPPGVEDHGIEVGFGNLRDAALPASWNVAVAPGDPDLRLKAGGIGKNDGTWLPNLNDLVELAGRPDLGAFERGAPMPEYGPR
ncbi:MAG: hypothetical protein GY720_17755 [bacterium]|nr:hypothetical protein [bacterium]